jgi:hypothetical protein
LGLLRFGFGLVAGIVVGVGREKVVVVGVDGVAEGFAPTFGAEGVGVFALRDVNGLGEGLAHVSNGAGKPGLYIATDNGGDEVGEGRAEIAGGEVVAGE